MLKLVLALILGASPHYQTCILATQSGEVYCSEMRQDRQGAELKALAVNAASQGAAVAWVQKIQKEPKGAKPLKAKKPVVIKVPDNMTLTEHVLDAYGHEANR